MKDFLADLNAQQREAAETIEGEVFILAGAGSGKTKTLVSRVANMIDNGVESFRILLLTFTNKAAKEMKDRIIRLMGPEASKITACTFHSFCAMIMRKNAQLCGLSPDFTIIDDNDASDAIAIAKEEFLKLELENGKEYDKKDFPKIKDIAGIYSASINNLKNYDVMANKCGFVKYSEEIVKILALYKRYKKARNLVDYDDLLYYTYKLLSTNEGFRQRMDRRYMYISCDEYQDTNPIQNQILMLMSQNYRNLAVVGDDNQSIYAFRGADISNILGFAKRHPNCKTITLYENYRSSQEILTTANEMMEFATEGIKKQLHAQFTEKKPELVVIEDAYAEADYVVKQIQQSKSPLSQLAVMCRSSAQSYIIEQQLNKLGIPFQKFGGMKFLDRAVIKNLLAYLRLSVNAKDEIALFRVLQLYPGIGRTYAHRISEMAAEGGFDLALVKYKKYQFYKYLIELRDTIKKLTSISLEDQLDYLVEEYYMKTVQRNIEQMKTSEDTKSEMREHLSDDREDAKILKMMAERYKDTKSFITDIMLDNTKPSDKDEEVEKLNITTIHSAKGLEYDEVYLLDVINGIFPKCTEHDKRETSEERRCAYVAVTRAKHRLVLLVPKFYNMRHIMGKLSFLFNQPSIIETFDVNVPEEELLMVTEMDEPID